MIESVFLKFIRYIMCFRPWVPHVVLLLSTKDASGPATISHCIWEGSPDACSTEQSSGDYIWWNFLSFMDVDISRDSSKVVPGVLLSSCYKHDQQNNVTNWLNYSWKKNHRTYDTNTTNKFSRAKWKSARTRVPRSRHNIVRIIIKKYNSSNDRCSSKSKKKKHDKKKKRFIHRKYYLSEPSLSNDSDSSYDSDYRRKRRKRKND